MGKIAEPAGPLLVTCCVVAVVLAGCTKGYPTEDSSRASPFDMPNNDRIAALNEIGEKAHPDRRWIYSMERACDLSLEYRRKGNSVNHSRLRLMQAMDADVVFDKMDRTFDVVLRKSSHREAQVVATVLESKEWTDASHAELYFKLLIRDCEART